MKAELGSGKSEGTEIVQISRHARKRTRGRVGIPAASAERTAAIAFEKGITHGETRGSLKRWLDGRAIEHGGSQFRIYGAHLYIFGAGNNVLITVLHMPRRFARAAEKLKSHRGGAQA